MKNITVKTLVLSVAFALFGCSANSENTAETLTTSANRPIQEREILSFDHVAKDVARLNNQYGAENVLIVVDIDNTLLTSTVDLGSDTWYLWQRGKLDLKPSASQEVKCLFEDSIGLLYELVPMMPTEKSVPSYVKQWQAKGNTLFALTSRAPKYRAATERELARAGINLESSALAPRGQTAPVYREVVDREISYMKGVMMTSGLNKGEMLAYILEKTGREFDAFVFVDDSKKNIVNVFNQYKNNHTIDRNIYHYVNIEHERAQQHGSIITEAQAEKMTNDWRALNKTLNSLFPERKVTKGCLSVN